MQIQSLRLSYSIPKKMKKQIKSLGKHHTSVNIHQTYDINTQNILLRNRQKHYSQNIREKNKRILTEKSSVSLQANKNDQDTDGKTNNIFSIAKRKCMKENLQYMSANNINNGPVSLTADYFLQTHKKLQKKSELAIRYRNKYLQKQLLNSNKTAMYLDKQSKENYQLLTGHHENCILKLSSQKLRKSCQLDQKFQLVSGITNTKIMPTNYCIQVESTEIIEQLNKQLIGKESIIKNQQQLISHYKIQLSHYQQLNQPQTPLSQISQQKLPSVSQYQFNSQPSKQLSETTEYLFQRLITLQQQLCTFRKLKTQLQHKITQLTKDKFSQIQMIRKKSAKQIQNWREMYFSLRTEMKENFSNKNNDF